MGEVYRAKDIRLGRDVAIKALSPDFSSDPDRVARFDREARALAGLNHPHIAAIHDVEELNNERYLVMELVEGETLEDRIGRGPFSVEEAIDIAKQIAEALAAAHERGIIHRDLKPANIKITPEGNAKILDFGLAKEIEGSGTGDLSTSPTAARLTTMSGVLIGTAAYMSPEQARGQQADRRSDVWAFGVIVWEMLTGRSLFGGESVSDTLAAVLRELPNWQDLPSGTPPALIRILRRTLAKRSADRMRDFVDVRLELEEFDETEAARTDVPPRWRVILPWLTALIATSVALAIGLQKRPTTALPLRKTVVVNEWSAPAGASAAISPDGNRIAYFTSDALWVRDLEAIDPRKIDTPVGRSPIVFWSPDGKWIAYVNDQKLSKVPASGATPTVVASLSALNASGDLHVLAGAWGADDRIVLALWRGGLVEVSARGGTPAETLHAPNDLVDFHHLAFLPDGQSLLAVPHKLNNDITVELIRGTNRQTILRVDEGSIGNVGWSPDGHIVFAREGANDGIWAVSFDLEHLKVMGRPFIVAPGGGDPSTSRDGSLAYVTNLYDKPGRVVRFDGSGKIVARLGEPVDNLQLALLSPDGQNLAFASREADNKMYIRIVDIHGGTGRRLTAGTSTELPTAWSRDGRQLVTSRFVSGNWSDPGTGVWLYNADGTGKPKKIGTGYSATLTPDGKRAVFNTVGVRADANLAVAPLDGSAQPLEFIKSPSNKLTPVVSPDGQYVAYTEVIGGQSSVFVARFPSGDARHEVAQGRWPQWSADGRKLYFVKRATIMSTTFDPSYERASPILPVVEADSLNIDLVSPFAHYQILNDGTLLGIQRLPSTRKHLLLVQNWYAEFKE